MPWITSGLQIYISIEKKFLLTFIRLRKPSKKVVSHKIKKIQISFIKTSKENETLLFYQIF